MALETRQAARPDLFSGAGSRLSLVERINIALVRATFTFRPLNWLAGLLQRGPGAGWVDYCTRRLRHVHGLDRLPPTEDLGNFILVSNHRSYFDLFVITMVLFRAGLRQRMLFPVRSNFFYDHPLGFLVNGVMSFWSMYPPIFRERKKLILNHTAMGEAIWILQRSQVSIGIHPEGTRGQGDDPYTLLPAQAGVGRVIHQTKKTVIPVFINGLINKLPRQVKSNFDGTGQEVHIVFGAPIDFGELLDAPANAKTFRQLAEATTNAIATLGREERELREAGGGHTPPARA